MILLGTADPAPSKPDDDTDVPDDGDFGDVDFCLNSC